MANMHGTRRHMRIVSDDGHRASARAVRVVRLILMADAAATIFLAPRFGAATI